MPSEKAKGHHGRSVRALGCGVRGPSSTPKSWAASIAGITAHTEGFLVLPWRFSAQILEEAAAPPSVTVQGSQPSPAQPSAAVQGSLGSQSEFQGNFGKAWSTALSSVPRFFLWGWDLQSRTQGAPACSSHTGPSRGCIHRQAGLWCSGVGDMAGHQADLSLPALSEQRS